MTFYFLVRDYNILPKKELRLSPWVELSVASAAGGKHSIHLKERLGDQALGPGHTGSAATYLSYTRLKTECTLGADDINPAWSGSKP